MTPVVRVDPPEWAIPPETVRLWLATKLPDGRSDTLYFKDIRTSHTPGDNDRDRVELWEETDDRSTLSCWIKERYWDHTGRCNVTLWDVVADPTDEFRSRMVRRRDTLSWTTKPGGPPLDRLLQAGGWQEWGTDD